MKTAYVVLFLRHWQTIKKGMYQDWKYMMENIIEDMPPEHKNIFLLKYQEYSKFWELKYV